MLILAASAGGGAEGGEIRYGRADAPVIRRVKVISDSVPDVSSVENLIASITRAGASGDDRAIAVAKAVHERRFWAPSSRITLPYQGTDPIIVMNCSAATICQQDAEMCCAIWSGMGFDARYWQLGWHTTPEVFVRGKWRHVDPTFWRVTRDDKGEFSGYPKEKLRPESYVGRSDGYTVGHEMHIRLRRHETFTRHWGPVGRTSDYWIPSPSGGIPTTTHNRWGGNTLQRTMRQRKSPFELPDDAAYGNGVWKWRPDLSSGDWKKLFVSVENVARKTVDGKVRLVPAEKEEVARLVAKFDSPYIMTGGWVRGVFHTPTGRQGRTVSISCSCDGGRSWRGGPGRLPRGHEREIDLRTTVTGRFQFLMKIEMGAVKDTDSLYVEDPSFEIITQVNPFALGALKLGQNTITYSAGEQLERITVLPDPRESGFRKSTETENLTFLPLTSLYPETPSKPASITYRLSAPGDIVRARWGAVFTTSPGSEVREGPDPRYVNRLLYSFDGEKFTEKPWSWRQTPRSAKGEMVSAANFEALEGPAIPRGAREVWLRYHFERPPIKEIYDCSLARALRIDVDHRPLRAGRLPPVEITYRWEELDGEQRAAKSHTHVARGARDEYRIKVGGTAGPVMKSISMRLAPTK